jgi:hypothetical protein
VEEIMKAAAAILGLIGAAIALWTNYLAFDLAAKLGTDLIQLNSYFFLGLVGIPVVGLVGAGMTFSAPASGGILMLLSAGWMMFFYFPNISAIDRFIGTPTPLMVLGGVLALLAAAKVAEKKDYDSRKWENLIKYDEDVSRAVQRVQVFGGKWVDQLASSYLSLNDKQYLDTVTNKIIESAEREKELEAQIKISHTKAEEILRSRGSI